MKTYALDEQVPSLSALVEQVKAGEEIVLTDQAKPVAKLVSAEPAPQRVARKAGFLKGKIWMAPDFDEPLDDFKECME